MGHCLFPVSRFAYRKRILRCEVSVTRRWMCDILVMIYYNTLAGVTITSNIGRAIVTGEHHASTSNRLRLLRS
jgi:hypothetical protein